MDDRIRISDADRESVTARLREHFAEGRLTSGELDDRITAALSAKTYGDLRAVMSDLPEPAAAAPAPPVWPAQSWGNRRLAVFPRGPRFLPLAIVLLIAAIAIPHVGLLLLAFIKFAFLLWLIACLVGVITMVRFRRHMRKHWRDRQDGSWHPYRWRQYQ